jgi:hypothetical protein
MRIQVLPVLFLNILPEGTLEALAPGGIADYLGWVVRIKRASREAHGQRE